MYDLAKELRYDFDEKPIAYLRVTHYPGFPDTLQYVEDDEKTKIEEVEVTHDRLL